MVVTAHGSDVELAKRNPLARRWARYVMRCATYVVGVGSGLVDDLKTLARPSRDVRLIPMGLSRPPSSTLDSEQLAEFKRQPGLKVVFVGRCIPLKQVDTLVEAAANVMRHGQPLCLALVGDGPLLTQLQSQATELALPMIAPGQRPPPEVPEWLCAADVLVLPSATEGRGLVLLEAMSQGVATVASDIPGPRDLIRHNDTGLLFPSGNVNALTKALQQLATQPELRARLAAAGREFAQREEFSMNATARAYVELYSALPNNGPDAK